MAATVASDFTFVPKVWNDHIMAYFDRKLVYGAFALYDDTLTQEPGETVNFPYYKAIGAAEEPAESASLTVDNLEDDSFSATVKEVGKAVGFKDKSLRKSAARKERNIMEAQSQIARVHAEKVDLDLVTEIGADGNSTLGYEASAAAHTCTVNRVFEARVSAFGDKADQTAVIFMHSLHYLSMFTDSTAGFLKADATDPMFGVPGFMGRLFGAALVVVDTVPEISGGVDGKRAFKMLFCKPNAYGFMTAEQMQFEKDRDILARESIITATQWYAVKHFHAEISADDKRIGSAIFTTGVDVSSS